MTVPPARLRIALAQTDQVVGDLAANAATMLSWRDKAAAEGADLMLFPELQLIGYPPEDLVLKPALVERAEAELVRLAEATSDGGPAMLVGTVIEAGGLLFNCVALLDGGTIAAVRQKRELANHGAFDEKRLFAPGPLPDPIEFRGVKLGLPVGEDIWFPFVTAHLADRGADILVSVHGSPFEVGKDMRRRNGICAARVHETGLPILYLNRVGGQDELVFDGASFVMDAAGEIACRLPEWEERLVVTEWVRGVDDRWCCLPADIVQVQDHPADIYCAMLVALRDFVARNGFAGVAVTLTGSVESALGVAIAVDAVGAERVRCLATVRHAAESVHLPGVRCDDVPVDAATDALGAMLAPLLPHSAHGAALLGDALSTLVADAAGYVLLSTANKGEIATGAVSHGGYAPLKDAYRTTVIDLAQWRNAARPDFGKGPQGPVIAERLIATPSAGPEGAGAGSLPPHDLLDPILYGLVEQEKSVDDLAAMGFERTLVAQIEALLHASEHRRRQAPPGVKIGARSFGRDRRYPISNAFRTA